jgi:lipoprotein-anchoring transpeptidase ErfK/SrfK
VVIAVAAAGAAVALVGSSDGSGVDRPSLPPPRDPAFVIGNPPTLDSSAHTSEWAAVAEAAIARRAPSPNSPAVARVPARTPEGTGNIVQVLARTLRAGRVWLRVRLPSGAAGLHGWLPRRALSGYGFVRTRLVVDRARQRATLLRDGRPVFRAAVGVGSPRAPTPAGDFYIRNRLTRYASPAYGPIAFGTSARSDRLTDWPAGGFIGIHGTDRPGLLPGRVSHGCIRMRNASIRELDRLMPIGTPLTIR